MNEDLLFALALYQINNIGSKTILLLLEHYENIEAIFKAKKQELLKIKGIGEKTIADIVTYKNEALKKAEKEIKFIEKNEIDILFYTDNHYPNRLKECHDAPFLLFCKGNYNFNVPKILSIVGTRHATDYGKKITQNLVEEFTALDICIISGLALGIDSYAHQSAVKHGLQNIAVLGHGLDMIYPSTNKQLAEKIEQNGALVTDFFSETLPNKQNFPRRNRIVAGMSDAVVVIESAEKGGALITAEIANSYNKEVFAIPGNIDHKYSVGCNQLIKNNKAQLATEAKDIISLLNWDIEKNKKKKPKQAQLFLNLSKEEEPIYQLIKEKNKIHIDDLIHFTEKNLSNLSSVLLQLELRDLIQPLPGKYFAIV
jgi:DNA processing protein